MRIAFALAIFCGVVAACKDGVTPDCTTDPTVCSPIENDGTTQTPDASDAASPTTTDADTTDAADAADASG